MGLPIPHGTAIIGSTAIDAASYVLAAWLPITGQTGNAETWRLTVALGTATYLNRVISNTQSSAGIITTIKGNAANNQVADADYGFTYGMRGHTDSGTALYYNFKPAATTTIKAFWIDVSRSENSVV